MSAAEDESEDSGFGDSMALDSSMTMTCSTAGMCLGTAKAAEPVPAIPPKQLAESSQDDPATLLADRMTVIAAYDLSSQDGLEKFAKEVILQRRGGCVDAVFDTMDAESARQLRGCDTVNCVDFWSGMPCAHGDVVNRFQQLPLRFMC